jgi:SAM-dependent methyltransferase
MVALEIALEKMTLRGQIAKDLIDLERPELSSLFLTYQNEALAARRFLEESINELEIGAEILEVGGGILALAIQLADEGFKVTTVEPVSAGFNDMIYIMEVFLNIATKDDLNLNLIKAPIENCTFEKKFDFIFSINVMEHLLDPYVVLCKLVEILKPKCHYRFFAPNYDFPYEPHFRRWMFKRKNQAFYLNENSINSKKEPSRDSLDLFLSLNYLTLKKLRNAIRGKEVDLEVNKNALYELIVRASYDLELKKRHPNIVLIAKIIYALKLHYLVKLLPSNFQPVMDIKATCSKN